jgi:hypothetical protein
MNRHRDILRKVGDELMSMIAEAGGQNGDFFSDLFNKYSLHTLRTIMYPVRKDNIPEGAYLPDGRSEWLNNRLSIGWSGFKSLNNDCKSSSF